MRNLKLAVRTLLKTPFVTAVAVLSLALGIGANAAIYSIFNEMLRQPLPVPHPEQLVNLGAPGPNPGSQSCNDAGGCDMVFSYPMFRDLERANTGFSAIAAHRLFGANVAYREQTMSTEGVMVSGTYFPALELKPALGRLLGAGDDQTIGANYVAVLSNAYWQAHLGSDPSVIGRPLVVNGVSMTIVGVAPDGFSGTTLGAHPVVFVPISMRNVLQPPTGPDPLERRTSYWVYLFGRLKPGVSIEQARAAINAVYHPIINDVEAPLQKGMSDATMQRFKAKQVTLADGRRGQSTVGHEAKIPLVLLFAITGIVLLIACANIANLLLARGANRTMEMAVRLSLGATRRQILAQLLVESLVLAVMGGAASLAVARWTLVAIASMMPPEAAQTIQIGLHPSVVWFAAAVSVGTGILFGLFPALQSTRPDLVTALRNNSGKLSGTRGAARFRTSLVTAQIALSMALLISAGLFIKSLRNISRVDLGIKVEHVSLFGLSPELNGYTHARSAVFLNSGDQALAAIPGVVGVTEALVPLVSGSNWGNDVNVEGFKRGPDVDANSRFNEVGANYFHVVGMTLLAGRDFSTSDVAGAPKVAVVNEAFAKKFHLGRDAVGKHMSMGGNDLDIQIVGLVKDAAYADVKDPVPPVFFIPWRQDTTAGSLTYYVRSAGDPEPVLRAIPGVIKKLDPNLPVENLKTLTQQVKENVFLDRMIGTLSTAFALLATLLAAVGLYGVLAYSVAQRTREIGVRMALGADGGRVRSMVLRQVGWMTLIGGAIGIVGAVALGRSAQSLLYQLTGWDPAVMALSAAVLGVVALSAGYLPARRASRTDPMNALRYE
ncbi:MAG: ABC transporter permease [Gemmatimonadota bacterium]|nr:ABC transporter permease [Gemmatimonadota bacterium]